MKKSVRLPAHVRPERYRIMLKPDLENFSFSGEETIYLTLEKSTREIILHSVELEIECEEAKVTYDEKKETATLSFAEPIREGKHQLNLKFKGFLNDKMRGFYRSKYGDEQSSTTYKHLAVTQFESTDARRAFPCFDEPAKKAIFDVTLMIPSHTVAISNTVESQVLEHESGYKIVEFEPTPKMSTYLLAFIVGEFEYIEAPLRASFALRRQSYGASATEAAAEAERDSAGQRKRLVRVFTTPGKKEQARFALDVAIECLDFYEDYFGIQYPLPVLDLIAIPDFAAGAMENWGAVTYRESTLLVDSEKSSASNKQWVALVIAHELAHQWFGNLVTMEWWTHLWLNEGFASFIEYLAIDHIFPSWDIWTQFVANEMGVAYSLDALKNTHPIEVEVGHPAEISEIFDKVSYSKGASILRMLHEYLGAEIFQKGLQHYLKRHAFGNAQTDDLWKAMEEISGKPVSKVMKNWTSKPGHPLIRVQGTRFARLGRGFARRAGDRVQLIQGRFFSSPISKKESKDNTIWSIPLSSLRATKGSEAISSKGKIASSRTPRNDERFVMDKKTMVIDGAVKLNKGEASFVRVAYPHEYLKRLEKDVKSGKLSAPDRLGLIRDTFALSQSGNSPTTLALELAQSHRNEEDYTVWVELTGHISQLDSLLAYESFYENFRSYGRLTFGEIANKMGWEKKKEEKHTDSLLRSMVLYELGSFGDADTIEHAQELFELQTSSRGAKRRGDLINKKIAKSASGRTRNDVNFKIDPDLRGVVYNLVCENGGEKEFNSLVTMYKDEDNEQEKDRIGRALGKFNIKALLKKTLDFSISKHVRYQSTLQIIASVWGNPNGRYLAWEFVKSNWKLLKERYAGGHYFTRVFGPAGEFTRLSDAKDIDSFTKKNPIPEAKRTIAQALEQIYSNVEWLKRDKKGIEKFLGKVV